MKPIFARNRVAFERRRRLDFEQAYFDRAYSEQARQNLRSSFAHSSFARSDFEQAAGQRFPAAAQVWAERNNAPQTASLLRLLMKVRLPVLLALDPFITPGGPLAAAPYDLLHGVVAAGVKRVTP